MIKSVTLKNFQKHKDRHFDFGPVTTIVGPNRAGKSSLFRSIRWIVFNRPGLKDVLRRGSKEATVTLSFDDREVTRVGAEGKNSYSVDGREPHRSFSTDVPQAVSDACGMTEVNFQRQIDGPYLMTETAGEVARAMNKVIDLEVMDLSLAFAEKESKANQAEATRLEKSVTELEARVGGMRWLPAAEAMLAEAADKYDVATATEASAFKLERLLTRLDGLHEETPEPPDLSAASKAVARMELAGREAAGLDTLLNTLERLEDETCRLTADSRRNQEEVEEARPELCPTCGQAVPK